MIRFMSHTVDNEKSFHHIKNEGRLSVFLFSEESEERVKQTETKRKK